LFQSISQLVYWLVVGIYTCDGTSIARLSVFAAKIVISKILNSRIKCKYRNYSMKWWHGNIIINNIIFKTFFIIFRLCYILCGHLSILVHYSEFAIEFKCWLWPRNSVDLYFWITYFYRRNKTKHLHLCPLDFFF
jgi:hypothetical protein